MACQVVSNVAIINWQCSTKWNLIRRRRHNWSGRKCHSCKGKPMIDHPKMKKNINFQEFNEWAKRTSDFLHSYHGFFTSDYFAFFTSDILAKCVTSDFPRVIFPQVIFHEWFFSRGFFSRVIFTRGIFFHEGFFFQVIFQEGFFLRFVIHVIQCFLYILKIL